MESKQGSCLEESACGLIGPQEKMELRSASQLKVFWEFFKIIAKLRYTRIFTYIAYMLIIGVFCISIMFYEIIFYYPNSGNTYFRGGYVSESEYVEPFPFDYYSPVYYYPPTDFVRDLLETDGFIKPSDLIPAESKRTALNPPNYGKGVVFEYKEGEEFQGKITTPHNSIQVRTFFLFALIKHALPNIDIFLQTGKVSSIFRQSNTGFVSFVNLMVGASFGFLLVFNVFHAFNIRSSKILLVVQMSGARLSTIWLSFFANDLASGIVFSVLYGVITSEGMLKGTSFLICFGLYLLMFVSGTLFLYFILTFIRKLGWFIIVGILFIGAYMGAGFLLEVVDEDNLEQNRLLCTFVPMMQLPYATEGLCDGFVKKINVTLTTPRFGNFLTIPDSFLFIFLSCLVYFVIFVFFELMNPKIMGVPPIGWRNIFNPDSYKRLFMRRADVLLYDPFIEISGIRKVYKGKPPVHALNESSFKVTHGETVLLIGPNGSGKTTLINCMTGFERADGGELCIGGAKASDFAVIQDHLGICFQEDIFFPRLTVEQHLRFFALIRGFPAECIDNEVDSLISLLKLDDSLDTRANDLSGGQKRKLCIAIAISGRPPLVVLDEPTTGIDVATRQVVWKALASFKDVTTFVSSHSLEEAEAVSSKILVMRQGDIIFQGTANELRQKEGCGYKITLVGSSSRVDDMVSALQQIAPGTIRDGYREDAILIPIQDNMTPVLEALDACAHEYGYEGYTVVVEGLEHVLGRMIIESE